MLIVQKYGGTSVGSLERIEAVAERVIRAAQAKHELVVVVSAMSGVTNELLSWANFFTHSPSSRDLDLLLSSGERVSSALLAIALNAKGYPATAFSGRRAGILTDNFFNNARILRINTEAIHAELALGKIIIIAGFQGVDERGEVTTLGRGGSDLSAVALAGALGAELCEIYTDVDGVYTTDPRIEPRAKKLERISYDEMLELASSGAKVLQNRSVELAKKLGVRLITRSSFNDNEGTQIGQEDEEMEQALVSGIALDKNQARLTLRLIEDRPGVASQLFSSLAEAKINVDMIIQNMGLDGTTNLGFTVPKDELEAASQIARGFLTGKAQLESDSAIVKVSVVGVGMKSHSGVAAKTFRALANEGINIGMISTSEIKISMIIHEKYGELAVRALHEIYELDK